MRKPFSFFRFNQPVSDQLALPTKRAHSINNVLTLKWACLSGWRLDHLRPEVMLATDGLLAVTNRPLSTSAGHSATWV